MLETVKNLENIPTKLDKPKLSPLSTNFEKTSEVLRLEILNLQEENKQLLEDIKNLQDKVSAYLWYLMNIFYHIMYNYLYSWVVFM